MKKWLIIKYIIGKQHSIDIFEFLINNKATYDKQIIAEAFNKHFVEIRGFFTLIIMYYFTIHVLTNNEIAHTLNNHRIR